MSTIAIEKETLLEKYNQGTDEQKKLLTEIYGEVVFIKDITETITSFEAALSLVGPLNDGDKEAVKAMEEMIIITRALNGGVDLTATENWYTPYFTKSPFGFSNADTYGWLTCAAVGPRLCFRKREHAAFAGEKFLDKYAKFIPSLK